MEGTTVDSERFDGLARSVAERREEHDRDREQFQALTCLIAAKGSRRIALVGLLAVVLHGMRRQPAAAQCRSQEGKNKRQCRRREREDKAPGAGCNGQDKLFGVCVAPSLFIGGDVCCNDMACEPTFNPLITACQQYCTTDEDCKKKFPNKALACRTDLAVCPFHAVFGGKCCVPR